MSLSPARLLTTTVGRLGIRARLAMLIGGLFTAVGILVLTAQYLVVSHALDQEVRQVSIGNIDSPFSLTGDEPAAEPGGSPEEVSCIRVDVTTTGSSSDCPTPGVPTVASPAGGATDTTVLTGVADDIREVVLARLGLATGVITGILAVIAAALAWWLAGRPLRRIRQVTQLARVTSERDLHGRLDLSGPADEIRDLGDTIDTMLDRLEHAFVQRERFISNASHELRTPLAAGRAALEAPLAQGRFPPEVVPDVQRALAANARSAELISALLQLARTDLDPAHAGPVDLAGIAEAALDTYGVRIAARSLRTRTTLHPALAHGHETLLIRAVDNLLDNASRYTEVGGRLTVSTSSRAGRVHVVVENTGPGYTPEQASELREPFHRGPVTRNDSTGHGLGLAIVDAIVRSHHGSMDVRPRPGGGLTVTLVLPAAGEYLPDAPSS